MKLPLYLNKMRNRGWVNLALLLLPNRGMLERGKSKCAKCARAV